MADNADPPEVDHGMSEGIADLATPGLFQTQRRKQIVSCTREFGRVEVSELSARFGVAAETIRRDLSDLHAKKIVRRVHGGAVPWDTTAFEPLVSVRSDQHDSEKRRLAAAAVEELPDSGSVIIDSGSTLTCFAEAIPHHLSLRVVTNSLLTAQTLADHESLDIVVVGGKMRKNTMSMVDVTAVAAIAPLTVDTLFVSSDAASPSKGLTTPFREEAALKQAMIRAARRVVLLIDYSKFSADQFVQFATWSDIDVLITNTEVDREAVAEIEATGTTVVLT